MSLRRAGLRRDCPAGSGAMAVGGGCEWSFDLAGVSRRRRTRRAAVGGRGPSAELDAVRRREKQRSGSRDASGGSGRGRRAQHRQHLPSRRGSASSRSFAHVLGAAGPSPGREADLPGAARAGRYMRASVSPRGMRARDGLKDIAGRRAPHAGARTRRRRRRAASARAGACRVNESARASPWSFFFQAAGFRAVERAPRAGGPEGSRVDAQRRHRRRAGTSRPRPRIRACGRSRSSRDRPRRPRHSEKRRLDRRRRPRAALAEGASQRQAAAGHRNPPLTTRSARPYRASDSAAAWAGVIRAGRLAPLVSESQRLGGEHQDRRELGSGVRGAHLVEPNLMPSWRSGMLRPVTITLNARPCRELSEPLPVRCCLCRTSKPASPSAVSRAGASRGLLPSNDECGLPWVSLVVRGVQKSSTEPG